MCEHSLNCSWNLFHILRFRFPGGVDSGASNEPAGAGGAGNAYDDGDDDLYS